MAYERELEIAIEAAKEAGEILRNDFHRTGGPRGQAGHADADEEAEWVIRKKLLENFPDYRYLGEETGSVEGNSSRIWLVDPNDGTTAYLRGARGSAVSIALLENRIPVLGVVYSFAFPDDRGDLICYAEGSNLQRNGKPITTFWNLTDPDRVVVLVSLHRETANDGILECIQPYRYRTIPSIAYRLALVAAGDGTAAVSWHKPGDWDYAAGHALLRGAGGILIDEAGQEVAYAEDGGSQVKRCFGGAPKVVQSLSKRNWAAAIAGFRETAGSSSEPFVRAKLKPGISVSDPDLLSRAQGCFLGLCCADSVTHRKNHNVEPGRISTDCEMAILLARSITADGTYDPQTSISSFHHHFDPAQSSNASRHTMAMMRMVPLGIYGSHHLPKKRGASSAKDLVPAVDWFWRIAAQESALILPEHPILQQTCALLLTGIALLVRYGETMSEVREGLLEIAQVKPDVNSTIVNSLLKDLESHPAIAAAFTGALQGRESIPRESSQMLLSCRPTSRPRSLWAVDLLTLTELLLL